MKPWKVGMLSIALTLGMTAGCSQKCFISEKDYYDKHLLPSGLEERDPAIVMPPHALVPAPPNVDNPDRPARPLSLQEAIAIALENGATSSRNGGINNAGLVDDSPLISTGGSFNGQSDRVRVLALQPAISAANIEAAISRFDAQWFTRLDWAGTDKPQLVPGGLGANNGTSATFESTLMKLLSSGGVANITYSMGYNYLTNPSLFNTLINPAYEANLKFGFEQPLLKNFGTEINQLLTRTELSGAAITSGGTTPGALSNISGGQNRNAFSSRQGSLQSVAGQPNEGILITRLRFDQQRTEFERQMQNLLLNVEVAYWKLYQLYGKLYSNEEVLRVLHKTWIDNYYKAQGGTIALDVLAQIRGQYEEFRGERTASLQEVLEAERNLRGIMGLPVEDGTRLIPVTPPTLAPFQPHWEAALNDALTHRTELMLARDNLRFHQMALTREKNSLQPDLRFVAEYVPVGVGTRLDGNGSFIDGFGNRQTTNVLRSLASDHFNSWQLGLGLNVPLGFRFEHASVRSSRLQLAQAYYVLKDQEDRVTRTLSQQYQELPKWYRLIEERRAERRAYADALGKKFKLVELGKKSVDLDLLDTQRRLALALTKEYQAIGEYNNTLARLEFARGTIMQANNVVIAEGPLTPCAQIRAVEHERERTKALILCEPPNPLTQPGMVAADPRLPTRLEAGPMPPAEIIPVIPVTPLVDGTKTITPAADASNIPVPVFEAPKTVPTAVDPLPTVPERSTFEPKAATPVALPEKTIAVTPITLPPPPKGEPALPPLPAVPDAIHATETPAPVLPGTAGAAKGPDFAPAPVKVPGAPSLPSRSSTGPQVQPTNSAPATLVPVTPPPLLPTAGIPIPALPEPALPPIPPIPSGASTTSDLPTLPSLPETSGPIVTPPPLR